MKCKVMVDIRMSEKKIPVFTFDHLTSIIHVISLNSVQSQWIAYLSRVYLSCIYGWVFVWKFRLKNSTKMSVLHT